MRRSALRSLDFLLQLAPAFFGLRVVQRGHLVVQAQGFGGIGGGHELVVGLALLSSRRAMVRSRFVISLRISCSLRPARPGAAMPASAELWPLAAALRALGQLALAVLDLLVDRVQVRLVVAAVVASPGRRGLRRCRWRRAS